MPRYVRNTAILAKIETNYGTDSTPTGAANAMLISDLTVNPFNAQNVPRNLIRGYMGGSEQLVGNGFVECTFTIEMAGAGTAGNAPAWGPLLRACGFAETVSTGTRVEYSPISTSLESVSIYYHDDGLLHKVIGARGSFDLKAVVSDRPTLQFKMIGLDGGVTATANPTAVTTAFVTPKVVTDAYTSDMIIGGTYTTGTLGAGTTYVSGGLEVSLNAAVQFTPLVGSEQVLLTNREPSGKVMLDATAAQEATLSTSLKANTLMSVGLTHGTAAGNTVVLFGPYGQLINWRKEEKNGLRMIGYDVRFVPSTGNDEFKICVR